MNINIVYQIKTLLLKFKVCNISIINFKYIKVFKQ